MKYQVIVDKKVYKELDRIPVNDAEKISQLILNLADNSRPPGCKKLEMKMSLYRMRQGEYRIIYTIDDKEKIINVVDAGHRKDIYKEMN